MDLIARGLNGRLDAFAACKQLWSGTVRFGPDSVVWNGDSHRFAEPEVDGATLSLFRIRKDDFSETMPDLLDLLAELEADESLRVDPAAIAGPVRDILPCGQLTGATLFLLQSAAHPLIVDRTGTANVLVRYDERLARGIPHLQDLLHRLLCHLCRFNGESGPLAVRLSMNDPRQMESSIVAFEGCVEGGAKVLAKQIEIQQDGIRAAVPSSAQAEEQGPKTSTPGVTGPADSDPQAVNAHLQSCLYAAQILIADTRARIEELEQLRDEVNANKPVQSRSSGLHTKSGLTTEAKAARSLVVRSVWYVAIGIGIFALGRACVQNTDMVLRFALGAWDRAVGTAKSAIALFTDISDVASADVSSLVPTEPLANATRTVGLVLLGLGIVFPVHRIIRYKRRLDKEHRYTQAHMSFIAQLTEQQRLGAEAAYAQALQGWSDSVTHTDRDIEYANKSLDLLLQAREDAGRVLEAGRERQADASGRSMPESSKRTAERLQRSIDAETTEEARHNKIVGFCEEVQAVVELARRLGGTLVG